MSQDLKVLDLTFPIIQQGSIFNLILLWLLLRPHSLFVAMAFCLKALNLSNNPDDVIRVIFVDFEKLLLKHKRYITYDLLRVCNGVCMRRETAI